MLIMRNSFANKLPLWWLVCIALACYMGLSTAHSQTDASIEERASYPIYEGVDSVIAPSVYPIEVEFNELPLASKPAELPAVAKPPKMTGKRIESIDQTAKLSVKEDQNGKELTQAPEPKKEAPSLTQGALLKNQSSKPDTSKNSVTANRTNNQRPKAPQLHTQDEASRLLLEAISNQDSVLPYALINNGADVNASNRKNSTALMLAVLNSNLKLAISLTERGAEINRRDDWGWTALLHATIKGNLEMVDFLLEQGADPDLAGTDGRAPIIAASWNGYPEILASLINANADVNLVNRDGWTALSCAAWQGNERIAKLLLNAVADKTVQTYEGMSALQLAEQRGHTKVIDLLK